MDTQGDAFFVVFARAGDGVSAAVEAQRGLADGPVRVRMGRNRAYGWPCEVTERMLAHRRPLGCRSEQRSVGVESTADEQEAPAWDC